MSTSSPFNYDGLYSQLSVPVVRGENRHAKYDFAVAYPDPDTFRLAPSPRVRTELCRPQHPANFPVLQSKR